jgi:hypothetical protein
MKFSPKYRRHSIANVSVGLRFLGDHRPEVRVPCECGRSRRRHQKKAQYPSAEESQRARFRNHRESREQPVRLGVETCGEVEDVGTPATGAAAPEGALPIKGLPTKNSAS